MKLLSAISQTSHQIEKKPRSRMVRRGLLGWGVILGGAAIIAAVASTNSRAAHILAFLAGWLTLDILVVAMITAARHLRNQRRNTVCRVPIHAVSSHDLAFERSPNRLPQIQIPKK